MNWSQLIAHIYYTHQWESEQICNMHNNNMCDPHKCQELCLLCRATHGVTSDLHVCIVTWCSTECVTYPLPGKQQTWNHW